MAQFGWAYVDCSSSFTNSGPSGSLQFMTASGAGATTGSAKLTFHEGSGLLTLTGSFRISGSLTASHYHIKDVTQIDSSGSTFFGNTTDDRHIRTGSMTVIGRISSSLGITASHYKGDGSGLTGLDVAINTYSNAANNRVLTSINVSSVNSEANLQFDGSTLTVVGAVTGSGAGGFQSLAINGNRASIDANGAATVRELTASAGIKALTVSGSGQGSFESLSVGGGRTAVSNAGVVTAVSVTASAAGSFQSLAINGNRASITSAGAATFSSLSMPAAALAVTSLSASAGLSGSHLDINNGAATIGINGAVIVTSVTASGFGGFQSLAINGGVASISSAGALGVGAITSTTITATTVSGTYGYFKNDVTSSAAGKFATLDINNGAATVTAAGALGAGAITATSVTSSGAGAFQSLAIHGGVASISNAGAAALGAVTATSVTSSGAGGFQSLAINGNRASITSTGAATFSSLSIPGADLSVGSLSASAGLSGSHLDINNGAATIGINGAGTFGAVTVTSVTSSGAGGFQSLAINGGVASISNAGALGVGAITSTTIASTAITATTVSGTYGYFKNDVTSSAAGKFATLDINNGAATVSAAGALGVGAITSTTITATTVSGTYGYFKNDVTSSAAGKFATLDINNGAATLGPDGVLFVGGITATTVSGTYGYFKNDVTSSAAGKFATLDINNGVASVNAAGALVAGAVTVTSVTASGAGGFQSLTINGGVASISNAGAASLGAVTATSVTSSGAGGFQSLAINGNRASITSAGAATFTALSIPGADLGVGSLSASAGLSGSHLNINNGVLTIDKYGAMGINEEPGVGVFFKSKAPSDENAWVWKSPSHETLFAITGSGQVAVGGVHLAGKFNVSGSDLDTLISAKSNTRNPVFSVDGIGEVLVSGSMIIKNASPTIYFSSSHAPGTPLAQIGVNSSDNILIQNDTANKHIVMKANDAGTLREGFRIDGAIPEVVVNQGSDSLIDFRVESDNNANMLYVQGSTDKIGINTAAPSHLLSVSGSAQITGDLIISGSLRAAKTIDVTRHFFQYGGTSTTFLPMGEGASDDATTATEKQQFVAAFSGRLKRVIVRPANAQNGHVTASIWVAADGVADFNAGGSIIQHVTQSMGAAAIHANINFSGSTPHFVAGDIVGISIDFRLQPGNTNATCIWEYDDTTI